MASEDDRHALGQPSMLAMELARLIAGALNGDPQASEESGQAPEPKREGKSASQTARRGSIALRTPADLGTMVRQARERRQLSQQAFADLAGVGRRFLSELENGKPTVELGKVLQVLAAAGIDLVARERA